MEEWKDIKGYEGLYQVSTLGRVRSFHAYKGSSQRILVPGRYSRGYLFVQLSKDKVKTQHMIHRLVASTFIPNPEDLPQVNHKDEDKTNNCVENLEWCTAKYNANYGTRNERVAEKTRKPVMCVETGEVFDSVNSAMALTHLSNIHHVLKGKYKMCGGYHWRYA